VKIEFRRSFLKDLKLIDDKGILKRAREKIEEVKQAKSLSDISNLKKLKGSGDYYRIRVGDYRFGIAVAGENVIFVRFLNRKEIYKYFP
jgi:mRNA interferase RelE/StbE